MLDAHQDYGASQGGPHLGRRITRVTAKPSADTNYPGGVLITVRSGGNISVIPVDDSVAYNLTGLSSGDVVRVGDANVPIPICVRRVVAGAATTVTAWDAIHV